MTDNSSSESETFELVDHLAYEITQRIRSGQQTDLNEYLDRYPHVANDIREMITWVADFEMAIQHDWKSVKRDESGQFPQIDGYRLLRRLGRGGMGVVYEAQHKLAERRVAIKVLKYSLANQSIARERYRCESRTALRLNHPNIVPVYDVGEDKSTMYYSMQLISGHGLDRIIDEQRTLHRRIQLAPALKASRHQYNEGLDIRPDSLSPAVLTQSLLRDDFHVRRAADSNVPSPSSAQRNSEGEGSARADQFSSAARLNRVDSHADDDNIRTTGKQSLRSAMSAPHGLSLETSATSPNVLRPSTRVRYYNALARLGIQIASALSYIHARGIIHRDIKPSNILLDKAGTAWVTDFGLAIDGDAGFAKSSDIVGTIRYMAPECFSGCDDHRSDIYSLGLTLYELLVLRPAYVERRRTALIDAIRTQIPLPMCRFDSNIPHDLEAIVYKAIEKEPVHRYASADDLVDDLHKFLDDKPTRVRPGFRHQTHSPRSIPLCSRKKPMGWGVQICTEI